MSAWLIDFRFRNGKALAHRQRVIRMRYVRYSLGFLARPDYLASRPILLLPFPLNTWTLHHLSTYETRHGRHAWLKRQNELEQRRAEAEEAEELADFRRRAAEVERIVS
jgi:hypothetical protein